MKAEEIDLIGLAEHFSNEDSARAFLEGQRWPDGPVCPHCGVIGEAFRLEPQEGAKSHARKGLWKCKACREQFSVTVGTIMADSHIPLNKWLLAFHLLCASKKGMSAHQLHRMLHVTYKSAWFMAHRIRYAMSQEPLSSKLSGIVEADETYIGGRKKRRNNPSNVPKMLTGRTNRPGPLPGTNVRADKATVLSIRQRGGKVRSMHMERITSKEVKPILKEMLEDGTRIMTDTSAALRFAKNEGFQHDQVNHRAGEYVRYEDGVCITTNGVESFFNILKRGINGVYHHVGKRHLHRYLSEFDFRYNAREVSDGSRTALAIKGAEGKRLMYRDSRVTAE